MGFLCCEVHGTFACNIWTQFKEFDQPKELAERSSPLC